MSSSEIVIAGATRTAVGSFNGALSSLPAHDLGKAVITEALTRAATETDQVDEVIMGQVLTAGQGQNPARQASINAGLPSETTAWVINQLCGSGLRAVALGIQQIQTGAADIIVAGGQESMSMAPHCQHLRQGVKMGDYQMIDTMIRDGLWDAFNGYHMGMTAENVAREFQITRDQQDAFAVASQNKAEAAQAAGRLKDEIVPVTVKTRKAEIVVDQDEYIRAGATVENIARLRPAFQKDGTVTAGNASGLNDGAAAVVVMRSEEAERRGVEPMARVVSWAHCRRRSRRHGDRADSGVAQGAGTRRLVDRRSRPDRSERGLCGTGLRGQQGPRLGHRQGQRQWRCDRHRPSHRGFRCAGSGDASP